MTREEREYVIALAEAADALRSQGNQTPSAEDIAREHFVGKAIGGAVVADVRKKMLQIRNVLADPQYGFGKEAVPVSGRYYNDYRRKNREPGSVTEARQCLALGRGKFAEGLHFPNPAGSDLIWEASLEANLSNGAGKIRKSAGRVAVAYDEGRLVGARAVEMLGTGYESAESPEAQLMLAQVAIQERASLEAPPTLELEVAHAADEG